MSDRTVSLRISADIQDLQGKLRKASNDMRSFAGDASRSIQKNRADWGGLSTQVGLFGGAMVAATGLVVKGFADFDKSMSKVKASGADAAANLSSLRDAAVQAGADTQYSAAEAADAITDLAKAGVSAKDILGGGLAGSLALAAAGEMDVKEAAETTAVALTQFRLAGSQSSHVADLLAAGAGKAMGEVTDLGMALKQSGLVANQVGMSIEETVGALSSFAAAGMLGSDAGTSLKTMLQRLTPQSKEAQDQFDKLGISAYNSKGQFVGLSEFAGQLQGKMSKLTPEARNSAMAVMFGADAVRAANVLYSEGAAGVEEWTKAVNDQGFASRQAAILTDNLAGDLERLGGSIDTVFIQSGSGANNALRGLAQGANAAVDAFGQLPEPILSAGALITGAGGLGVLGVAGMMKLAGAASDAQIAFKNLGISAKGAGLAAGAVGAAISIGVVAFTSWAQNAAAAEAATADFASTLAVVDGKAVSTFATMQSFNTSLVDTKTGLFGWGRGVSELMNEIGISAEDAQGYIRGEADAIARVNDAVNVYWTTVESKASPAAAAFAGGSADVVRFLDQQQQTLGLAKTRTEEKAEADRVAASSASSYAAAIAKSNEGTEEGSQALAEYTKRLWESANAALKLSGTQIGWEAALDDVAGAIKKTGKAQRDANGELDLNTAKGRANQTALNQLASASIGYAQNLMSQGASEEKVQAVLERSRKAFVKQAVAAGMSGEAARTLADDLGLIPENTKAKIVTELKNGGMTAWDKWNPETKHPKIQPKLTQDSFVIKFNTKQTGGPKLATGGPVWGAGTETSDSIPALLSNNEHVWTAAEVRAAGGHGRVERLRALALSGDLPGFAKGGAAKKKAKKAAAEAAKARAELLDELRVDVRRGSIIEDVAGGSGLTVVDRMLDWSKDTNLSKSARSKLASTAASAESKLTALDASIDTATKQVESLRSTYDSVSNGLNSFDLAGASAGAAASWKANTDASGNTWYTGVAGRAATGWSIARAASAKAATIKSFGDKLSRLQKAGASPAVLQDIADLGAVEGSKTADAFLADLTSLGEMNQAYAEMATYSGQAAQAVTAASYDGGLTAAEGWLAGLTKEKDAIGQTMASAFAEALGYSVVGTNMQKRAAGGPVAAGELYQVNEQGVEMFRPYVSGVILTASQTQAAIGAGSSVSVYVTNNYPQAEAASVTTNRALQYAAAMGV